MTEDENNRARAFTRRVVDKEHGGHVPDAARAFGVSTPMLYEFLGGRRGAGMKLLSGIAAAAKTTVDAIVGGELDSPALAKPRGKVRANRRIGLEFAHEYAHAIVHDVRRRARYTMQAEDLAGELVRAARALGDESTDVADMTATAAMIDAVARTIAEHPTPSAIRRVIMQAIDWSIGMPPYRGVDPTALDRALWIRAMPIDSRIPHAPVAAAIDHLKSVGDELLVSAIEAWGHAGMVESGEVEGPSRWDAVQAVCEAAGVPAASAAHLFREWDRVVVPRSLEDVSAMIDDERTAREMRARFAAPDKEPVPHRRKPLAEHITKGPKK